jgi:acyl carrier protein
MDIKLDRIKNILKTVAPSAVTKIDQLNADDSILDYLDIDSLKFIELIVEIEQEFNVEISDELLQAENFNSLNKIDELLSGL